MTCAKRLLICFVFSAILFVAICLAQTSSTSPSQSGDPAASAGQAQSQPQAPSQATDAKKPKKVWTNEDVAATHGQSLDEKDVQQPVKKADANKADALYVASVKKQLEKLEAQLRDTEKQLSDLKDFQSGKPAATPSGYQLGKGYNRVPVDQQIVSLEGKKKQIQSKINDLLDEARKKRVEPGQLR